MKTEDIKKMAQAWNQVQEASKKKMDPVDDKELKGTHAQRKDKDINNDGKVDSTDKYLHTRRKTVAAAIKGKKKDQEVEVQTSEGKLPPALQAYMDKKKGKKKDDDKDEVKEAATATHKPGVASPAGEGLSPSAKDQLAKKTPAPPAFDVNTVNKKTFDAIRASAKKAPMRTNDNAQGDKTPPKAK